MLFPIGLHADAATDEILARYSASLGKAKAYCSGLPDKINSVKTAAGISIAGGAVGTLGGGAAVATGVMKYKTDDKIKDMVDPAEIKSRAGELLAKIKTATDQEAAETVLLAKRIKDDKDKFPQMEKDLQDAKDRSAALGNVRTAGAFVSGAGGAVGAATSFAGLKTLDGLIVDMNACDSYVREIDRQAAELRFAAPDDPSLAKMNAIADSCKGMSSKNIADVKGKMKAAGIISTIGAVAGVAGGITSAVAASKEKKGASGAGAEGKDSAKGLNMASNISSGIAAAGNLGGAILSGVTLAGLNKNSDIAAKCADAF
jgi:hypothetical protein